MNRNSIMHTVRMQTLAVVAVFALLMVALLPSAAHAETQLTHGFLRYEIEDNSVVIIDYAGDEEVVWVPAYIAGLPVNHIAMGAFSDAWTVKKILLPDTVTNTDEGAFNDDQEVIFDWNVGRGSADDDQPTPDNKNDEKKDSNQPESNSSTNRGTSSGTSGSGKSTTGTSGGTTSKTSLAKTGDQIVYVLPVVLAGAAAVALGVIVRRRRA